MPTKLTNLAVSSFGKLDGIVINHGVLAPKRFADCTIEEWKQLYDVNVFSGIAMVGFMLPISALLRDCPLTSSPGQGGIR